MSASPEEIVVNSDPTVERKDMIFRFKKDKLGNKRSNVTLKVPVPSAQGIAHILSVGGKELELLLDACYDVVRDVVGEFVGADENVNAENFDYTKATWQAIANMPKEDRRSSTIPAETWEAFAKDYIECMPGFTGKTVEAVTNATVVYLKKFAPWKSDKKTLGKLKEQLGIYMENSTNAEQYTDILEVLVRRVDTYLAANDLTLVAQNL
jgi:hypothetical protein